MPDDYYKKLYNNNQGYTFGIQKSKMDFKAQRKADFDSSFNELKDFFQSFDHFDNSRARSDSPIDLEAEAKRMNRSLEFRFEKKKKIDKIKLWK